MGQFSTSVVGGIPKFDATFSFISILQQKIHQLGAFTSGPALT